jgi:DNA-binding response OmpR family regulator
MDGFVRTGMSEFWPQGEGKQREGIMPRVLVIDDDASMRESLKDLLSLEQFDCDVAESGKMGLAMFELNAPELVVLDAQLPDVSGFQVCQVMKKGLQVPVVMVSGRFTEPQDRVQGFELGADDFFTKPFDPMLFVARVKNLLRMPLQAS